MRLAVGVRSADPVFLTVLWKRASLKNPRRDSPEPVTGVMAHLGITVDGTRAQTYIQAQGVA
jgi:hypothetical protein